MILTRRATTRESLLRFAFFMNFFAWYFGQGLTDLIRIEKNFLWFVLEFFSVGELLKTLFFPWHRDISQKYWRGFNPVRMVRNLAENLISRILGAIVRTMVIFFGLGIFFLVGVLGLGVLLVWVAFPVVAGGFIFLGIVTGDWVYILGVLLSIGVFLLAIWAYLECTKELSSDANSFLRRKWFFRVLNRMGLDSSQKEFQSLQTQEELVELLKKYSIPKEDLDVAMRWEQELEEEQKNRSAFWRVENLRRIRPMARQWRFGFTPHLDQFGFDILSSHHLEDIRVCAHPKELESMKMTMTRGDQNCVLLVAPSGTGKRSLIRYFAKQLQERSENVFSPGERFIQIDLDRVFSMRSQDHAPQEMVEQLFLEAIGAGNIVLIIEDIDRYLGETASRTGAPDISGIIAKYLPVPDFRLIATVSGQGFHASVERNEGMLQYLEVIELDPIDDETALRVLLDEFDDLEKKYVTLTIPALRSAVRHSLRFHPAVPLPERALDVVSEAILFWEKHPESRFITEKTMNAFISFKTGVPLGEIGVSEKEKLVRLEQILAERVIGQPEAVRQVAQALKRARTGMSNSTRAIGSFLFLGPTGVGKTELAKTLSTAYFGKTGSLVRLDMSEYQNPDSIGRLIGSQSQNVPGQLASLVRDTPYGVLLLDELEKANSGVLDLFLQILDEGFFTDAFGQQVMFTNMIIIATSNAGANVIRNRFAEGADADTLKKELIEYIADKNIFRTEFLNRFDGVVFFHPIDGENALSVCRILLNELVTEIKENRGIDLKFGEGVAEKVVQLGYDPTFGARSLRRFIAETVEAVVADVLLEKNPARGEVVRVLEEDILKISNI